MEKYGLTKSSSSCPLEYLNNNTIDQRIWDYLRVIQTIRGRDWWNGKLIIVGGSEGGVIAPMLASFLPETTKVVVMAAGTGWTMREEMLFLLEKRLRVEGQNEQAIKIELKEMTDVFAETIVNPTSTRSFYGETNTFRWWSSILNLRPIHFMLNLNIPILMVHGDTDSAAPVESARATFEEFKKSNKTNLTYIEYPGLDHSWRNSNGGVKRL